jgi:hypothetical protein
MRGYEDTEKTTNFLINLSIPIEVSLIELTKNAGIFVILVVITIIVILNWDKIKRN